MIIIEPKTMRPDNKHAKGQCEKVIRLIGRARDMEKERQVHAHLRDRERPEQTGTAGA